MPERIFLIRHGQSTFNERFDETGVDPQILDAPLSLLGREQAVANRAKIAQLSLDILIVSPLTRALETALLVAPEHCAIDVQPICREGLFCSCDIGRDSDVLAAEFPSLSFHHLQPGWWLTSINGDLPFPETDSTFVPRAAAFVGYLSSRPEKRIGVVGHASLFRRITGISLQNCDVVECDLRTALKQARRS